MQKIIAYFNKDALSLKRMVKTYEQLVQLPELLGEFVSALNHIYLRFRVDVSENDESRREVSGEGAEQPQALSREGSRSIYSIYSIQLNIKIKEKRNYLYNKIFFLYIPYLY